MPRSLKLGPVVAQADDGRRRLRMDLGGRPLWFESADADLDDGIEAGASAVLMAAVAAGRPLEIAGAVSTQWLANADRLLEIWRDWWGYRVLRPQASVLPATRPRAPGAALCFSGGVDSFHTLLCGPVKPEVLAFVHGYDIALGDASRLASFEPALRQVAATAGAQAVVVRSNLRQHRAVAGCPWQRSHGGALAAVGHLLAGRVGSLLLSSSFPTTYDMKWGSHWQLDALWSSDRLEVVHWGATHSRVAKVREIAGHDLAQRHLRVCWENRAPSGNCSRCDKCLCTMALIEACGARARFPVFDWPGSLADHIDRVPWTRFVRTYVELLDGGVPRRLAESLRSLLERTARRPAKRSGLLRCLDRVWRTAPLPCR
jgi:hypothetical protein